MKKIFVFSFFSVIITFFLLYYINFVLLVDSSITKNTELKDNSITTNIAFIPKGYNKCDYNDDYSQVVFLNNNMVYLVDLNKKEHKLLKELFFVQDVSFVDKETLLYVTKNNNSIVLNIYNLADESIAVLGELSFRYFTNLNNVYRKDDSIYFDVEYLKDGMEGSKSYIYSNDTIKSRNTSFNISKEIYIDDIKIYTNTNGATYINNSLFTYKDSSNFEILGKDSNDILYLIDKETNSKIVSLAVSESINIIDEYDLEKISYKYIMCTDSLYLISENFIYDLNKDIVFATKDYNVFLIANGLVYYEHDGELLYEQIIGR